MPYTTVVAQSAKPLPGAGIQIVLVASGAGLPDAVDAYVVNGVPFDPLTLRRSAIALLARLNANDDLIDQIDAIIGLPIDVTPIPPPPPDPTEVAVATFVRLWFRFKAIQAAVDAHFGDPTLVGPARRAAKDVYDGVTDPALKARLDLVIKGPT